MNSLVLDFDMDGLLVELMLLKPRKPIVGNTIENINVYRGRVIGIAHGGIGTTDDLVDHATGPSILLLNGSGLRYASLVRITKETSGGNNDLLVLRKNPQHEKERHHSRDKIRICNLPSTSMAALRLMSPNVEVFHLLLNVGGKTEWDINHPLQLPCTALQVRRLKVGWANQESDDQFQRT